MARRPTTVLRVQDLESAVTFYQEGLGFELSLRTSTVAQVTPTEGMALLLAAPSAAIGSYMGEGYAEASAGSRVYCFAPYNLVQYRVDLHDRRLQPGEIQNHGDGSRTLELSDPDGFLVSFWEPPRLSDQEVIDRFEQAPRLLAEALEGLSEQQLDLARAPGKWTIRQIVHHVTDSASSSLGRILMALAEPGRTFRSNPYSQDKWVVGLDHAHRPVHTALALTQAIHQHVSAVVHHLDTPLDRWIEADLAGRATVRQMLTLLAGHVSSHCAQIWETRRVHTM